MGEAYSSSSPLFSEGVREFLGFLLKPGWPLYLGSPSRPSAASGRCGRCDADWAGRVRERLKAAQKEKAPFAHGALNPTTHSMIVRCDNRMAIARQPGAGILWQIRTVYSGAYHVSTRVQSIHMPELQRALSSRQSRGWAEDRRSRDNVPSLRRPACRTRGTFVLKYFLLRKGIPSRRRA